MKNHIFQICLIALACMMIHENACAHEHETQDQLDRIAIQAEASVENEAEAFGNTKTTGGIAEVVHQVAEKTKEVAHTVKEAVEHKAHDIHVWSLQMAQNSAEKKAQHLKEKSDEAAEQAKYAAQHAKEVANNPTDSIAQRAHDFHVWSSHRAHNRAQQKASYLKQKSDEAMQQALRAAQHAKEITNTAVDDLAQQAHAAHVWSAQKAQNRAELKALRLKEKAWEAEHRAHIAKEQTKQVLKRG